MNKLVVLKHKLTAVLALVAVAAGFSQEKFVESFNASDDIVVRVNTSYTNIIFETWNKDKVEVEAFVEGKDLTKEQKQQFFKEWDFNVMGNSKNIVITSNAQGNWNRNNGISAMDAFNGMDFLGPLIENALTPVLSSTPELTETVLRGVSNINFDYDEFKKDEEAYMKKFEKQMEKNFGKDFERDMEAWGKQLEQDYEKRFGPEFEARMEAWGEQFGKEMEAWGEQFGKEMENWGKQFENGDMSNLSQKMEEMGRIMERSMRSGNGSSYSKTVTIDENGNKKTVITSSNNKKTMPEAKKTIIIRMPKNTKTEINVKHGDIKMADAYNVKATLNHTPFTAQSIDGGQTLINASYAPVMVKDWNNGNLYVKFVDKCVLDNVQNITLKANSTDVRIGSIKKSAFIKGSFGAIVIGDVDSNFEALEIQLENTDAAISVPKSSFSFMFDGKRSTLKYPKTMSLDAQSQGNFKYKVTGFNQSNNKNRNFTIIADYSNVLLKKQVN